MSCLDLTTTRAVDNRRATREPRAHRKLASWLFVAASIAPSAGCALSTEEGASTEDSASTTEAMAAPPGGGNQPNQNAQNQNLYQISPTAIMQVIAGGNRTCVKTYRAGYYCWGSNSLDLLGASAGTITCNQYNFAKYPTLPSTPPFSCALHPVPMNAMAATQLSLGSAHVCARNSSGQAFCWGDDSSGALGTQNGVYTPQSSPTPVSATLSGQLLSFSDLSAGDGSTCGVESGTGNIYCWGNVIGGANLPVALLLDSGTLTFTPSATGVNVGGATKLATGLVHACATFSSASGGGTTCFGGNGKGQTGPGALGTVSRVSTRDSFTCDDQPNGTVQCFGDNSWGQLGNGLYTNTSVPQTVGGGMALHGVAAGDSHACALDASGAAFCWGLNDVGQVGQRHGYTWPTPQPVPGNLTFNALASGSRHTCGLTKSGHVFCWGSNSEGQLGNGTFWGSWDFNPEAVPDP